jgi:hypothetical protein
VKARLTLCATAGALFALTSITHSFAVTGTRWTGSSIVMQMQVGASPGTLIDGNGSWDASAADALSTWNPFLNGVSFRAVPNSRTNVSLRNGANDVAWADDMYGESFGDAIAVTVYLTRRGTTSEADVLFNRGRNWNSYRGNLRRASAGGTLLDFHRVALHEFGHVLGLDHPDEAGQSVAAIMNSRVGNTDALTADDINGVRSIYGGAGASTQAPPPNRAPTVTVSCNPCEVKAGRTTNLVAAAGDPDGDALTYSWAGPQGSFTTLSAALTMWTAPLQSGPTVITVTVRDTRGASASASVAVTVLPRDTLETGERLTPGDFLTSTDLRYRLVYQTDGNLVLYDTTVRTALWASNTSGSSAGAAVLQDDGNFVLYNGQNAAVFSTGTQSTAPATLVVQSDGNLVLYAGGQPLWHRFLGNVARAR